jgi:hypothetical protein
MRNNTTKSSTPRRLTPAQSAAATAGGITPAEVHELTEDNGIRIVVAEIGKSKGGNVAGYQAQLHNAEGYIIKQLPTLYPKPTTCAHAAREAWPAEEIDEGKALRALFSAFVGRWNDFIGLKAKNRLDEIGLLSQLAPLYTSTVKKADKAEG